MRAIQITEHVAGPEGLVIHTLPDLLPTVNHYVVAVHAVAANFFDLLQIAGKYQHQPPLPFISGSEFSGVIAALPTGKSSPAKFSVGDHVFGAFQGAYATQIQVSPEALRPIPKGWDFLSAAGLMVTAPTAYAALVTRAGVKKNDWVLVHAAAGGVGLAAVQVAKALGATVIATAGTARKLEVARSYGADYTIDYTEDGWETKVKDLSPLGKGVDVVFDPVGEVSRSLKCTAWNGRIVIVGFAGGKIENIKMNRVLLKNVSLVGLHWGMYSKEEPQQVEVVWRALSEMTESGKFKSTVFTDQEFNGLDSVPSALNALKTRGTWGKVVIRIPQRSSYQANI